MKVKLRQVITQYASWTGAVVGACERGFIYPMEAGEMMKQMRNRVQEWIGEELLEVELE